MMNTFNLDPVFFNQENTTRDILCSAQAHLELRTGLAVLTTLFLWIETSALLSGTFQHKHCQIIVTETETEDHGSLSGTF